MHGVLRVYLKYHEGQPVIRHLERVSRPGRRQYVGGRTSRGSETEWGWRSCPLRAVCSPTLARAGRGGRRARGSGLVGRRRTMSRIGKKPVADPRRGSTSTVTGTPCAVKGPKGELTLDVHPELKVKVDAGEVVVERPSRSAPTQGAARPLPHPDREHGGRRDEGIQQDARDPRASATRRRRRARASDHAEPRLLAIPSSTSAPAGITIDVPNPTTVT